MLLLLSNAVTTRRDKSILYSRITLIILLYTTFIAYTFYFPIPLSNGIGLFGGLFHVTSTTHTFHIFIFLISAMILTLTSFYPRKV
jgi:NADH-ubiquinone oxidoreductase chain 2